MTNLIVLGHHRFRGRVPGAACGRPPWPRPSVTACCVGVWARHEPMAPTVRVTGTDRPVLGWAYGAIVVVVVLVLTLSFACAPGAESASLPPCYGWRSTG